MPGAMEKVVPFLKGDDYQINSVVDDDKMEGSVGKRWAKLVTEFSVRKSFGSLSSLEMKPLRGFYIHPDSNIYQLWWYFMIIMCVLSAMFTPFQFGFFRGLPRALWIIDLCVQAPFIMDILVRLNKAYKDPETFELVVDHRLIFKRYLKKDLIIELYNCLPWDTIYKGTGHHEAVRCLVWLRVYRIVKLNPLFGRLEKDIRFNYFAVRIVKLLCVEAFFTHSAACFYYYLATTVKRRDDSYTWIGSLLFGSFSYANFRSIDIGKKYVTALYWAVETLTTVGYGDIHAVNIREMIFVMIFVSFNMLLAAYLVGNMSALIVKGSATERFRDKMSALIKYMDRHHLPYHIRKQMKRHIRLQFETRTQSEYQLVEDLPDNIRSKIANSMYGGIVQRVPIFKGCSSEFLEEIISKVAEEHFLPGEVVIHQGGASDQFYIVSNGILDEILIDTDEDKVETIQQHETGSIFGEVGVLCNIPQPYTVRVSERCRLLRLDKHTFTDLVHIYFNDGRLLLHNLMEMKDTDPRIGHISSNLSFLVAKQAAELALMVNSAAFQGNLEQLKVLVKQGAEVAKADYDGRTALHLAASKGFESIVQYLIEQGADVNAVDTFGITPLQEAVTGGHDHTISVLQEHRAELRMEDPGSVLCQAVHDGNNEQLKRLLRVGADPDASDYDKRTALHLASAEGHYGLAKILIEAGADVQAQDRYSQTALDEATMRRHTPIIPLLKEAAAKRKALNPSRPSPPQRDSSDIE